MKAVARSTCAGNTVRFGSCREDFSKKGVLLNINEKGKKNEQVAYPGNNMEKSVGSRYCGQVQLYRCVLG